MSARERGALLRQDVYLLEKLAHFDRERIPPRSVDIKGVGGYFEIPEHCTKEVLP
jgi:catalase